MSIIGCCKECGNRLRVTDKIPQHFVFECDKCGYPNGKNDIFHETKQQEFALRCLELALRGGKMNG